jgi:hypothetical protein
MLEKFTKKDKRTNLEKRIAEVEDYLMSISPESKDYSTAVENLERLYKAKANLEERKLKISPDTIAVGVFGIIQILMILNHEKTDIITSKAFGYILKGKA